MNWNCLSRIGGAVVLCLLPLLSSCSGGDASGIGGGRRAARPVIRITGSDTMVNLLQAWAEEYKRVRPDVVVQVAGGGSGVGIAGLIDRTLDIAAASREIRTAERVRVRTIYGGDPVEVTVAFDALAVFVHKTNPLDGVAIDELAEIYGEHGRIQRWSQLGIAHGGCTGDTIIRIGRQNNSGTFAYFRDVVLGLGREYKMGSIDQSGSKDVVALVSRTPCAIGYSGIAYATPAVKALGIAVRTGAVAVAPTRKSLDEGCYPFARPLYLYTPATSGAHVEGFLEWVAGAEGQRIVSDLGFVPVRAGRRPSPAGGGD